MSGQLVKRKIFFQDNEIQLTGWGDNCTMEIANREGEFVTLSKESFAGMIVEMMGMLGGRQAVAEFYNALPANEVPR